MTFVLFRLLSYIFIFWCCFWRNKETASIYSHGCSDLEVCFLHCILLLFKTVIIIFYSVTFSWIHILLKLLFSLSLMLTGVVSYGLSCWANIFLLPKPVLMFLIVSDHTVSTSKAKNSKTNKIKGLECSFDYLLKETLANLLFPLFFLSFLIIKYWLSTWWSSIHWGSKTLESIDAVPMTSSQ